MKISEVQEANKSVVIPSETRHIGFTGHRDRLARASTIIAIFRKHPEAEIIHGGAGGFDTQVNYLAEMLGRKPRVVRPDYKNYPPHIAPIIRNGVIVEGSDVIVACWDGRETGGTHATVVMAVEAHKYVYIVPAIPMRRGRQ